MRERKNKGLNSLQVARNFLRSVEHVTDVYMPCGYSFFRDTFFPYVELLSNSKRKSDRLLAAHGYYILGDIYEFNDAPQSAIFAYRRSIALVPDHAAAWRETGVVLDALGRKGEALFALRKAVKFDPNDIMAKSDLSDALEDLNDTGGAAKIDIYTVASELMVKGKFKEALNELSQKRGSRSYKYKARVYGAIGDVGQVLEQWGKIAHLQSKFNISFADWFFLPKQVWNSCTFWKCLWNSRSRIKSWMRIDYHDSLADCGIVGKRHDDLYLRYHIARTGADYGVIQKLNLRFPEWKEISVLKKQFGC